MAKRKKVKEEDPNKKIISSICDNIAGAEILHSESLEQVGYVSCGNIALDYITSGKLWGGGFPMGRITEIFGGSSTGKTVIGTHVLQGVQKQGGVGILLDSESAYSAAFGEVLGLDMSQLIYLQPECLEDCFRKIIELVKFIRNNTDDMRPVAIVYDSIAASPSRRELEKIAKDEDIGASMGHRALVCSDYLRNIASFLAKQKAAIIVINQTREKIGVMFGSPETTAGGGKSLEFFCSVRHACRGRGQIIDKQKRAIGVKMDVQNVKNKISKPFRVASELELFFDLGISPTSGLIKLLVDEEKLSRGGAWYTIIGSDVKFQKKDLADTLLKYPELIEAPDSNAVRDFLGMNEQSLEASLSEEFSVEDMDGNVIEDSEE